MEPHDFVATQTEAAKQWIRTTVTDVLGPDVAEVDAQPAIVAGHYRRGRRWNCVVGVDGRRLAAIHVVVVPAMQLGERRLLTMPTNCSGERWMRARPGRRMNCDRGSATSS